MEMWSGWSLGGGGEGGEGEELYNCKYFIIYQYSPCQCFLGAILTIPACS